MDDRATTSLIEIRDGPRVQVSCQEGSGFTVRDVPRFEIRAHLLDAATNREPIRTAGSTNRDKRVRRRGWNPKPAVSGSDSPSPICQNPTEPREFLGLTLDVWGESLLPKTQWRWAESGANSSLGCDSDRE
jgi:hypothetical protein